MKNHDITTEEAAALIADGTQVIDVRTREEFTGGHIKGAMNIDMYSASFEDEIKKLDKNKTYVVNCQSGGRSGRATERMKELGFIDARNLVGGITAWQKDGHPVER